ncbi:hypothetical protein GY45DRAFT_1330065 [Cubamyces sp. BRFM 1775]|nr:hypothetical protein GY45DRAFT_1330065 [Cubamyces sp. BRFM 1775]
MDLFLTAAVLRVVVLAVLATSVAGTDVNRTIDDQNGDSVTGAVPLYRGAWAIGQTCTGCGVRAGNPIDPSQAFDGTWHDASSFPKNATAIQPSLQVSFVGHAVYVYNIVINIPDEEASFLTYLTFYIDTILVGYYVHLASNTFSDPPVSYRALVYSNDTLEQGEHVLDIMTTGEIQTLTLFDYIVYTTTEDDTESSPSSFPPLPSPSSPPPLSSPSPSPLLSSQQSAETSRTLHSNQNAHTTKAWTIAGGVVGGVLLSACLLYVLYRWRRHRRRVMEHLVSQSDLLQSEGALDSEFYRPTPTSQLDYTLLAPGAIPPSDVTYPITQAPPTIYPARPPSEGASSLARTKRLASLTQHIHMLQAQMSRLRSVRRRGEGSPHESILPSELETNISIVLAALREEVATLRAALG